MWIFLLLLSLDAKAALAPWKPVELVEVPADNCLPLSAKRDRILCVSESKLSEGERTEFFEVQFKNGKVEKRSILKLEDTSNLCGRPSISVSRFYAFESKDVNNDGTLDAIVLVRAGRQKRQRGFPECPKIPIGTAIYEIAFENKPSGLESHEPSYAVLKRLQALQAIPAE